MDEQSFSLSTSKPSMGHLFPCSLLYRSYSIIRIDYKPLIILFILCFQTLTANLTSTRAGKDQISIKVLIIAP